MTKPSPYDLTANAATIRRVNYAKPLKEKKTMSACRACIFCGCVNCRCIDMSMRYEKRNPLDVVGWLSTDGYQTVINEEQRETMTRRRTRIRWDYQSEKQSALFLVWQEWLDEEGEVEYAEVLWEVEA